MFLVAMVDYFNKINSIKLKTNLLIISFALILIFGSLCVAGFMTHGLSEANDISDTVGEVVDEIIRKKTATNIVPMPSATSTATGESVASAPDGVADIFSSLTSKITGIVTGVTDNDTKENNLNLRSGGSTAPPP